MLVVNEAFARQYFPDGRVIGRRLLVQSTNQALAEVVGVVGNVRHNGLTSDAAPTVFLLHAQTPGYITNLVVRTSGDPLAQAAAIRRVVHEVDPTQAVSGRWNPRAGRVEGPRAPRLRAILVTCLAVIAVVLAAIGPLWIARLHRQSADARDRDPAGARRHTASHLRAPCSTRVHGS